MDRMTDTVLDLLYENNVNQITVKIEMRHQDKTAFDTPKDLASAT